MNTENEEQTVTTIGEAATSATIPENTSVRSKPPSTFIGRHRLQAAISHLQHQITVFQDELDELESIGGPSTVCDEMISGIESVPDPLLPMTRGPIDVNWERWFGGSSSSKNHRRWI